MRNYFRWVVLFFVVVNLCACHSSSKEYKDVLREGSWYVYDIQYSYQLYDKWSTPALVEFIHFMLEEDNLLFLPGDELVFSNKHVSVRCPNEDAFSYGYRYYGDYLLVNDYMLYPEGDNEYFALTFDERALEDFVGNLSNRDVNYVPLLDAIYNNLREFYITYYLQRPVPIVAQVMSGIYTGPLYDGTQQLINEAATVNLFWENGRMNFTMDDKITLEGGPQFHIDVPDLYVEEGRTPGSYVFTGQQVIPDSGYGPVEIQIIDGRFNASNTVSVEIEIYWKNDDVPYILDFRKGIRQWVQITTTKSEGKGIVLQPRQE